MYKKEIFLEIDANLHQPIQSMEADSNSRLIRFNLTNNYMPFRLTGKKVIFKAVKPDGTDIVNDCIIIDEENGIIEVEITKQINAISGRVNCQLSIIGADDYVLKTKKFIISVDSKLNQSGVVSSKEYKTLENALAKVQSIDENFDKVNTAILELATKGTTVEVIERATKQEIDRQIADGTIAHLTIQDGSVTPEKTSFYGEVASHEKVLKNAQTDYMGNARGTVKEAMDSNVDWLLGEINTVHYDGQHITATDSIEGRCKSAILKGQTLVNKATIISRYIVDNGWNNLGIRLNFPLSINSRYLINVFNLPSDMKYVLTNSLDSSWIMQTYVNEKTVFVSQCDSNDEITLHVNDSSVYRPLTQEEIDKLQVIIIEYQDGMENWDIPYFEGMKSVQMPVLTTTGKNLFDIKQTTKQHMKDYTEYGHNGFSFSINYQGWAGVKFCGLNPSKTYTLSYKKETTATTGEPSTINIAKYKDGIWAYLSRNNKNSNSITFTDADAIELQGISVNDVINLVKIYDIQLEEGSVATPYEPFKSNILSTPSNLELRGIGDVKDELNLLTGEAKERIGEIILDGLIQPEGIYDQKGDTFGFFYPLNTITPKKYEQQNLLIQTVKCDKLRIENHECQWMDNKFKDEEFISITPDGRLAVRLFSSKASTISEFCEYLSQKPITVQYQLETESIKTVDLSDNHVYSYKGTTHYDCSSAEGSLVPTLSIDVPTNLPAVVARQRVTIQELEKENVALKNEIEETANSSVNGDLELMSSQFELDFRLFEIEMNLDMPMMAMMRGVKSMAMTVYQQSKTLILAGKYEREDMEYKLNRYKAAGRIAVEEYEELIALMDARELVD